MTDEYCAIVLDEDGEPVTETKTTLYIYVNVSSMDYRDGAELYHFNADQIEMLNELMLPDYYPLFAELLGDTVGDGGEYGFGLDINPDLPPNELGAQIVQAAKKYIGRSYSSMDCSGLVRAAYRDCGLSSMNGLTSTGMAQKCRDMGVRLPNQPASGGRPYLLCTEGRFPRRRLLHGYPALRHRSLQTMDADTSCCHIHQRRVPHRQHRRQQQRTDTKALGQERL